MRPKGFDITNNIFCALLLYCLSNNTSATNALTTFPLAPRTAIWGTAGNGTVATLDSMLPLLGDTNALFYGDVMGKYGDDRAFLLSAGLGIRRIFYDSVLYGAYLFIDSNHTTNNYSYPVMNPGLEWMTNEYDAHLNGYVPIGKKSHRLGLVTGDQLGMSHATSFIQHTQYNTVFQQLEEVGSGSDVELGYTSMRLQRLRVFTGGYYFAPKHARHIGGGELGVQIPLHHPVFNTFMFELRDSYDNVQHNTATVSLYVTWGGLVKSDIPDIQDRLLDLIPRHLADTQTGDGIPSEVVALPAGTNKTRDNIWFFTSNPASAFHAQDGASQCTYEHPCQGTDFNQTNVNLIDGISKGVNFYFDPGSYTIIGNGFNNGLLLNKAQSLYGRQFGYAVPATGNERVLFSGGIALTGDSALDAIRLQAAPGITTGVYLNHARGILIHQSALGEVNAQNNFLIAIDAQNNSQVIIDHSILAIAPSGNNVVAYGISSNHSNVILANSDVSVHATGSNSAALSVNANASTLVFSHSQLTSASDTNAYGMNMNNSLATFTDVTMMSSVSGVNASTAYGFNMNSSTMNLYHSNITANASGNNATLAFGVNANASTINLFNKTNIAANAFTPSVIVLNSTAINDDGSGNQCMENGVLVVC